MIFFKMFSWCCPCRKNSSRVGALDRKIFLLMLGLDNAGKTCTAKSLVGDDLTSSVAPTVGFSKVETRYKGFQVTIYDLGGSKSFRGIWPKYFHEVHGFVFVVDASDLNRMSECRETFRDVLRHDKVRGKPLLVLCNKSDVEDAQDEISVVDQLNVERLVNDARCPTRVEPSVAIKNHHGLKLGFKWLVKSIIANMADLGPRVEADIMLEEQLEAKRRAELKKRIEERKRREEEEEEEEEVEHDKGFVAMSELRSKWQKEEESKKTIEAQISHDSEKEEQITEPEVPQVTPEPETPEKEPEFTESPPKSPVKEDADVPVVNGNGHPLGAPVVNGFVSESPKLNGHISSLANLPPLVRNGGSLDLEPITRPKKKTSLLRRLHRTGGPLRSVGSLDSSKPGSSKSSGSSVESLRDSQVIRVYTEAF